MGNVIDFFHNLQRSSVYLFTIVLIITISLRTTNVLANVLAKENQTNQAQITNFNITNKNNIIKLSFRLTNATKYQVTTLQNPQRLIVDFDNVILNTNIDTSSNSLFQSTRKSAKQDKLRIVFDLKNPVTIENSKIIRLDQNIYSLVINLSSQNTNKSANNHITQPDDPIYKLVSGKQKAASSSANLTKKTKILPIIIIDSGHGGKDPGTIGQYIRSKEKYITLGYARELKRQLDEVGGFKVFLTRDKDYFVPLNERVRIGRKVRADLFISLHADSSPDRTVSGLSIYTLSETSSDKQAELLAQKENKSDIIGGANFSNASGDILNTLINLSQRSTMNESAKFAEIIIKSTNKYNIETLQKTHRFAGFRVLTAPDIPSVLIELGYLSNKNEEKRLNSLSHRKDVAAALVVAIGQYFGTVPNLTF